MVKRPFGADGEWWVVAQGILGGMIILAPVVFPTPVTWPGAVRLALLGSGIILGVLAFGLASGGILALGRNLRAVPRPKEGGRLIQTGVYAWVRHPIYAGIIIAALGWSFASHSVAALLMAIVIFVFFDLKSRREEAWLAEKYADYAAYRLRVRKLIPLIY
jgi:protein-S-isoprenylcysteine O-methyltransferase Ste14